LNWIELLGLGIMIWKIKDIKDELNIRHELVVISSVWFVFSFLYIMGRYISNNEYSRGTNIIFFTFVLIRNLSRISITTAFSIYQLRNDKYNMRISVDSPYALMDFDTVIVSVIPQGYFDKFLNE
jgi:hypothetical protein